MKKINVIVCYLLTITVLIIPNLLLGNEKKVPKNSLYRYVLDTVESGSTKILKMQNRSLSKIDSASYAVGISVGSMIKAADFGELNLNEVNKAIADILHGNSLTINITEAQKVINAYVAHRQIEVSIINERKGVAFLKENGTKEGIVTTASGLQYKIIRGGTGLKPEYMDTIKVNYVGTLIDGTKFDSSYDSGQPVTFPLNAILKGWTEGLQFIGEGGKIRLFVPSELGYGEQQTGPTIGPNSTLIFDIELIKVFRYKNTNY
ncbi:MAG: FKBP-type peptidyl-prolyl cis-trans isomerase [Bacteroidales bacterium]|nr:FKBP-type peptidyl-prolyl cis-trans isomerase [Bacteroidales bacterium]